MQYFAEIPIFFLNFSIIITIFVFLAGGLSVGAVASLLFFKRKFIFKLIFIFNCF